MGRKPAAFGGKWQPKSVRLDFPRVIGHKSYGDQRNEEGWGYLGHSLLVVTEISDEGS